MADFSTRKFKAGIDTNTSKKRREDLTLNARRQRKMEGLRKKRNLMNGDKSTEPLSNIEDVLNGILSENNSTLHRNMVQLKRLLSSNEIMYIKMVSQLPNVIKILGRILNDESNQELQLEAAWCLTNLCSGDGEDTLAVISVGVVPIFINCLSSASEEVREQCVWAIGNIAGESSEFRDHLLQQAVLPKILGNCSTTKITFQRIIFWAISNLLRGRPRPDWEMVKIAIPYMCQALAFINDDEVASDCCWALSYITSGEDTRIYSVLEVLDIDKLMDLLGEPNEQVVHPALRLIGNIASGTDNQTAYVLETDLLEELFNLYETEPSSRVRKEICWILSNVVATGPVAIEKVLDHKLHYAAYDYLKNSEWYVKREAFYVIQNIITEGNEELIDRLSEVNYLHEFCKILATNDYAIIKQALEGLTILLDIGSEFQSNPYQLEIERTGGLTLIEDLQECENESVSEAATGILRSYWETEEDVFNTSGAPVQTFDF